MIRIQQEDFSVDETIAALKNPQAGAIVTFTGSVRDSSRDGKPVEWVEWDIYPPMAENIFRSIREEAIHKYGLIGAVIIHRYGRHRPGDNLVLIAAAAPHREKAFLACQWIMDAIKKKAPLWKKEILAGGEERWIEG